MANHYHDPSDLKLMRELRDLAPTEFKAWLGLNSITDREDGVIPHKYRELIAVAVALSTQCPYCIEVHTKGAKKAGATRQEIAETTFLSAALLAGGGAAHGTLALKLFDAAE